MLLITVENGSQFQLKIRFEVISLYWQQIKNIKFMQTYKNTKTYFMWLTDSLCIKNCRL